MNRLAAVCLGVLVVASLALTSAQAAVLVRSANDLVKDKRVQAALPNFQVASAANVVYDVCAKDYQLTADQIAYEKDFFQFAAKQYSQAFIDAYTDIVHYPPDAPIVASYTEYMQNQQLHAVNGVSQRIKQKSCADKQVMKIAKYVEQLHYYDNQAKAAEEAQQKRVPAVIVPQDATSAPMTPITTTAPTAAKPTPTTPTPGSH